MGAINRGEEREQARFMRWASTRDAKAVAPQLVLLFHVPNGGKRDAFTGAQLVAMGAKRGVPDLLFPFPTSSFHGLAIEMKSATGQLSDDQRQWFTRLQSCGWSCVVCRSAEEARSAIASYLGQPELAEVPFDE